MLVILKHLSTWMVSLNLNEQTSRDYRLAVLPKHRQHPGKTKIQFKTSTLLVNNQISWRHGQLRSAIVIMDGLTHNRQRAQSVVFLKQQAQIFSLLMKKTIWQTCQMPSSIGLLRRLQLKTRLIPRHSLKHQTLQNLATLWLLQDAVSKCLTSLFNQNSQQWTWQLVELISTLHT